MSMSMIYTSINESKDRGCDRIKQRGFSKAGGALPCVSLDILIVTSMFRVRAAMGGGSEVGEEGGREGGGLHVCLLLE